MKLDLQHVIAILQALKLSLGAGAIPIDKTLSTANALLRACDLAEVRVDWEDENDPNMWEAHEALSSCIVDLMRLASGVKTHDNE
jgi:hypothetical protein